MNEINEKYLLDLKSLGYRKIQLNNGYAFGKPVGFGLFVFDVKGERLSYIIKSPISKKVLVWSSVCVSTEDCHFKKLIMRCENCAHVQFHDTIEDEDFESIDLSFLSIEDQLDLL